MQKSLSDLTSLSHDELSRFFDRMNELLLVTQNGEPQFVAQSLPDFEAMIRRLRILEAERSSCADASVGKTAGAHKGKIIPFSRSRTLLNPPN